MVRHSAQDPPAGGSGSGGGGGRKPRKPSDKPRASWTDEEQKTIVDFLHTRRAEGGDQGTFKDVTWNALVDHLHVTHPTLPAKDINQVKGKWKTMKTHLTQICDYRDLSGRHWDPIRGANIQGVSAEATWTTDIKQFQNVVNYKTGWALFEKMMDIHPNAASRGEHKFSPRSAGPLVEGLGDDIYTAPSGSHDDPPSTHDSGSHAEPTSTTIDLTSDIERDKMEIDTGVGVSTQGASSTLISSVASGKRKALDIEDYAQSQSSDMLPPSSSAHTTSAASVASSGVSEQRKKARVKKETAAAATMRSSRQSSMKPPAVSDTVARQQIMSRVDQLIDRWDQAPAQAADPVMVKQNEAITLLEADKIEFEFSDDDFATVAVAFSNKPGYLATYLSVKQPSARHAFLNKIIGQG